MRPGFDERTDVLADESAFADVDQLLGSASLLWIELILLRDAVKILDHAVAQIGAVPHFEQQTVQTVGFGRRMLVELESLILELEATVLFGHRHGRRALRAMGKKA